MSSPIAADFPDAPAAVALLAFIFLPGYLAATTYNRNFPYAAPSDLRFLLQTAFWSGVVHVLAYPWTAPLLPVASDLPRLIAAPGFLPWFVFAILLGPLLLGLALGALIRLEPLQMLLGKVNLALRDVAPTAWDSAFAPGNPGYWVRIHLKGSGTVIAGKFGLRSGAGLTPNPHDIFLEEQWELDANGWFSSKLWSSHGVWVSPNQIERIELFRR